MPLHNTLTGSELHEPKGAATASEGMTYVADGAGSGVWTYAKSGWAIYKDGGTEQSITTAQSKLTIDGTSLFTETTYLPREIRGISQLWDTMLNKVTPIAVGDSYLIRLDLPITSRATANYATISLDIGGAATPTNVILASRVEVDRSAPFNLSVAIPAFSLSTFVTNGGQFFLVTDTGSIGITGAAIHIQRTHGES